MYTLGTGQIVGKTGAQKWSWFAGWDFRFKALAVVVEAWAAEGEGDWHNRQGQ